MAYSFSHNHSITTSHNKIHVSKSVASEIRHYYKQNKKQPNEQTKDNTTLNYAKKMQTIFSNLPCYKYLTLLATFY